MVANEPRAARCGSVSAAPGSRYRAQGTPAASSAPRHSSTVRRSVHFSTTCIIAVQFAPPGHLAKCREVARGHGRDEDIAILRSHRTISRTRGADRKLRFLHLID